MKKKYIYFITIFSSFILMSGIVDLNNLFNYQDQNTPTYISRDNTPNDNLLTDKGATLGRVLFYDKKLSVNNTISCSSCHLQEYAFGDTSVVSKGVNGVTGRHSMRLINARFSDEVHAFWDERAMSIEDQASQPIKDHVEMGYSGENGDPNIDILIEKMGGIDYYPILFEYVFGDNEISEERIQKSLAQFVRSIQSYDSKYDAGRAVVANNNTDFPNYTAEENMGKDLFFKHPPLGGAGCARCHNGPEFSLIASSRNNGVIGVANDTSSNDITVTKAPSLRDLVNPQGEQNGPFMHDGSLKTLLEVVNHYNTLEEQTINTNLDFRLSGQMHNLNLNLVQLEAIVAFLKTLSGTEVYTSEKLSSPFDENDNITVVPVGMNGIVNTGNPSFNVKLFPNPSSTELHISIDPGSYQLAMINMMGQVSKSMLINGNNTIDVESLSPGVYSVQIMNLSNREISIQKISIN